MQNASDVAAMTEPMMLERFRASPMCRSLDKPAVELMLPYWEVLSYESGDTVITEDAHDRDAYFLLQGEAVVSRHGVRVNTLRVGELFGEMALISGEPRSASVFANGPLLVARLTRPGFERLSQRHPSVAQCILHGMMVGLAGRLRELTDGVGLLLHERSLPRRIFINVEIGGETRAVKVGTVLREVLPREIDGHRVVAALVENKPVALTQPLSADCRVDPLTTASWEGARIQAASVDLLLLEAAHRVSPSLSLRLAESAGQGRRVLLDPEHAPSETLRASIEDAMRALVAADQVLLTELWTLEEAADHFRRLASPAATLIDLRRAATVTLVSYGSVYALETGPLAPSTGGLGGFRLLSDHDGWLLVYRADDVDYSLRAAEWLTKRMPRFQEPLLEALGIGSIGDFNQACIQGSVTETIRVIEGYHEKAVSRIADEIASRGDIKLITIAGPSSSGKTTFIKRLRVQMQVNGEHPVGLSLDDYYLDREKSPRDASGNYDFEALEALDLPLLHDHLERMIAGEPVETAHFDFPSGRSHPTGGPRIHLRDRDVLMLEGIHGLNPRLVNSVPHSQVFRIFVSPRAQLSYDHVTRVHASDVRLLRRIVRDRHVRQTNAASTIARWPSVRLGEQRHIFPFQWHADAVMDTSLIYELSVLKVYAERYLLEVPKDHASFHTAFRLLRLLDDFVAIYPDHVPPTSFLREFIGGSGFEY